MINVARLEELGFELTPAYYQEPPFKLALRGDDLFASFGEPIGDIYPMQYIITQCEQNGLIVQDYGFYVYGFRLETIPDIEEVEEFVDLYKEGMLC